MDYDTIIVGGGPAGYTAALYCGRAGLSALVLEQMTPGGQMATTSHIDNYPGFSNGTEGFMLAMEMQKQAERFGAKTIYSSVSELRLQGAEKYVKAGKRELTAGTVILATGASPRELGLAREQELRGKGVSYCATCDGAFYRDKDVVVVGGGDTAAVDAVFLSKLCRKVTIIHRRDQLRAAKAYQDALRQHENIDFLWNCIPEEILGSDQVEGLRVKNKLTEETTTVACSGIFVAVGNVPNTELFRDQLTLTKSGYILAGEDTKTSLEGVFAIGDVREKPLRQIVTAVSDGAVASYMAEEYLSLTGGNRP